MLPIDPPLAALHGARLDRSGAVAHGLINTAEHLVAAALRLQNLALDHVSRRVTSQGPALPAMLAIDVATDPAVHQMGARVFEEQLHLAADLGKRCVAWGEWHQHGFNALASQWLSHVESNLSAFPAFAGLSVVRKAVESVDGVISSVAVVAVQANEVAVEEVERIEATVRPRRRAAAR